MRLITIILLSFFCSTLIFAGCNDVEACNYGYEEDCFYPNFGECCEGFAISNQSPPSEIVCLPELFEYNLSTYISAYLLSCMLSCRVNILFI